MDDRVGAFSIPPMENLALHSDFPCSLTVFSLIEALMRTDRQIVAVVFSRH
jgi:hypothetical protein